MYFDSRTTGHREKGLRAGDIVVNLAVWDVQKELPAIDEMLEDEESTALLAL